MTKPTPKTRLDRDAVLAAAINLVDREGIDALSLASLAAELDRHVSSLYNHVEGLDGLRRDITVLSLEELGSRLWRAALGKTGAEGLRALAHAYRDFAAEHPGRFEAATTWLRRIEPRGDFVTSVAKPSGEAIYAVMASFGLEGTAAVHAVRSFSASIVGFIQGTGASFSPPPSIEDTFDNHVELFIRALSETSWLRPPTTSAPQARPQKKQKPAS